MKKLCAAILMGLWLGVAFGAEIPRAKLMEAWGCNVADDATIVGAELPDADMERFLHGVTTQLEGRVAPVDLARAAGDIERLETARMTKTRAANKARALAAAGEFFAQLAKNPRVSRLPSGLAYDILEVGRGPNARPEQTVTVNYFGRLIDGTEFVRMEKYELVLVPNRVTRSLYEGIQQVAPAGKIRIFAPPQLLAGDEAKLGVPLGAAAIFELELIEAKQTAPDDLVNSLLPAAPEPPAPPPSGFSQEQLLEVWGWTIGRQAHAAGFDLSGDDIAAFTHGLRLALRGERGAGETEAEQRAARGFVAAERKRVVRARNEKQLEAAAALFNELNKNLRIVTLPSGLRYEILAPGLGDYPKLRDEVIVTYTGKLSDGTVFDRTDNEPLHIEVGSVVAGWNEGIQKINTGGRIRLYIPPHLGYGEEDTSGVLTRIPANSTLIYEISLLAIVPAKPTERTVGNSN